MRQLCIFTFVLVETSIRERKNVNYEGFELINSWAGSSSFLDDIMLVVTNSVPYVAIAILLFLWFSGKKKQILERRRTAIYASFIFSNGVIS